MLLLCSRIFNSEAATFLSDQTIVVDEKSGLISDVRKTQAEDAAAEDAIDLRNVTVLPGFVDAHVHLFLHSMLETPYLDQLTRESLGERMVRAVTHAKATLLAGFTAVKDIGTEGAVEADVALRKCISSPLSLVPGPRMFCCTRGIACTGAYGPKTDLHPGNSFVDGVAGVEVVDGEAACRMAIRKQVGAGADYIKIYVDNHQRSRLEQVAPLLANSDWPLWSKEELKALIDQAHMMGTKVSAHATVASAIKMAVELGIDTIEHGYGADYEALKLMRDRNVIFVPTLAPYYLLDDGGEEAPGRWDVCVKTFQMALKMSGLKIAMGGDTGVFPHGENAFEMQKMFDLGMPAKRLLQAATYYGWLALRGPQWDGAAGQARLAQLIKLDSKKAAKMGDNDVPFGVLKKGFAADIIATSGDLEQDCRNAVAADSIVFVMKAGKIYKKDGKALV